MLPILMAASMEHEDTADRLRAASVHHYRRRFKARLLAGHVNEATARGAADAIVGGITYSIPPRRTLLHPRQAELSTR